MKGATLAVAVSCAVVLGGCVTRADFEKVVRRQQEMRAVQADLQVDVENLQKRVEELAAAAGGGLTGAGAASDRLAALEERVARLEEWVQKPATIVTLQAPGSPAAAVVLAREQALVDQREPGDPYRIGVKLFREGQCDEAVEKLRAFLAREPNSDLADNAQYWIGECYFSKRDFNRAILELNQVLLKYPQGDRVPAALLALASAFRESGDAIDAKLIVQKLLNDYPDTEEAKLGRQLLESLSS